MVTGILIVGVSSIGIVVYSQWISARDFQENATVIRMMQMIQQEISVSHLWFEELLGGDESIDLEGDVRAPIIEALGLIDAGLGRGGPGVEPFNFLPSVHAELIALRRNIVTFDDIVVSRLQRRNTTGAIGGAEDQMHDAVFGQILLQSQNIAKRLDAHIAADQSSIFMINLAVLVLLATIFTLAILLVVRSRRAIDSRAAVLESLINERTVELQRREAEAQLRSKELAEARDQADAASGAKSQFLANMSHEIRTPMNAVIGMASLLMRADLSPKYRQYVETMHSSGLTLLKIINNVLDFSKIEAGRIDLDKSAFSLTDSVEVVVHLFSAEAERKRLRLTPRIDTEVPDALLGDSVRLGQILANLVSNAIKYSKDGEVDIRVRLTEEQPLEPDSVAVRFEIKDCGPGIELHDQEKLFKQFSQIDGSATRSHGGTGLGLAISKELANLMGGDIGVDSTPGTGSTFWFTANFSIGLEKAVERPRVQHTSSWTDSPATSGSDATEALLRPTSDRTVLVVDDNEVNLLVAQIMIAELGFQVDFATNGRDAVEASLRNDYVAILMDSQMPGMDGNDATRAIRLAEGDTKHTPIIALTANALAPDRAKAHEAGVDDYLTKPVFLEDLEAVLSRLTGEPECGQSEVRVASASLSRFGEPGSAIFDQRVVTELRSIAGDGDDGLFSEIADQFVQLMPEWLAELRNVVKNGDTERARRQAHKLLGLCRQIGALQMAQLCSDLESAESQGDIDQLRRGVELLENAFDVARQELQDKYLGP